MNEPTAKTTSVSDERLAELINDGSSEHFQEVRAALGELLIKREFFADLADPQMTVCPYCLRVFQSQADLRSEAALRVARAAVNYIRQCAERAGDPVARQAVMLAAAQIGLG